MALEVGDRANCGHVTFSKPPRGLKRCYDIYLAFLGKTSTVSYTICVNNSFRKSTKMKTSEKKRRKFNKSVSFHVFLVFPSNLPFLLPIKVLCALFGSNHFYLVSF